MPQIQILPSVPTFGSKLAQVLGQAGTDIGQGYFQGKQRSADQKVLEGLAQNPNATSVDYISGFLKLSPEGQKNAQPLVNTILGNQGKLQVEKEQQATKQREAAIKQQEAEATKAKEQEGWRETFKGLKEKLPYTGNPYFLHVPFSKESRALMPFGEARAQREQFKVLAYQIEKFARKEHTKGTLQKAVYQDLLKRIPDANATHAVNEGRIAAWESVILGQEQAKTAGLETKEGYTWLPSPDTGEPVLIPNDQVKAALDDIERRSKQGKAE